MLRLRSEKYLCLTKDFIEGSYEFLINFCRRTNLRLQHAIHITPRCPEEISLTFHIRYAAISASDTRINNHLWSFDTKPIFLNSERDFLHWKALIRPHRPF